MATLIDILASLLVGGMITVNLLAANEVAAETSSTYNGDVLVQEILITQAQCIEGEFRNIGYGVAPGQKTILSGTDTSITFLCDINRDGNIDTVSYALGSVAELSSTPNELDRYVRRGINAETPVPIGTVTIFFLRYMNSAGTTLATPVPSDKLSEIHEVELTMEVQNPYAMLRPQSQVQPGQRNALYSSSYWQQTRLASQNFKR
jgi:hypothetical protein